MKSGGEKKKPDFGIRGGLLLFFIFCFSLFGGLQNHLYAGNVKIDSVSSRITGSNLVVDFRLSWSNSWRDRYNWDAVWVFAKVCRNGVWEPLVLQGSGHQLDPLWHSLGSSSGNNVGLFIYRQSIGSGDVSVSCRLLFSAGSLTQSALEDGSTGILLQGIEMVYIPWGGFETGDGSSVNTLVGTVEEQNTLSSTYPNGYRGFYMMKYELSQEQYVTFLNTLSLVQQQSLLGNLEGLQEGDYIFGSPEGVTHRNGIILYKHRGKGERYIFACNYSRHTDLALKDDVNQEDDGQSIACNYMSIKDLLGYASWSGLRPMAEYEYEKACRGLLPAHGLPGEFAWNRSTGASGGAGLQREGYADEYVVSGNVNYGGGLDGPVRCGSFGKGQAEQQGTGSSYWGVMELSGNLRELCINVRALNSFSRDVHGRGSCETTLWPAADSLIGTRGGGYSSLLSQLCISDRSDIETSLSREPYTGIRCVRMFEASNVGLDPGTISGPGRVVCACEGYIHIGNGNSAQITGIKDELLTVTYKWYVNGQEMPDAVGAEYTYTLPADIQGVKTYTFMRKAYSGVGEGAVSVTVTVAGNPFSASEQTFTNSGSANTLQIFNSWTTAIPQEWRIVSPLNTGLTVSARGVLSGIATVVCGGEGLVVEAKCTGGGESCVYTKKLRETGTRTMYSDWNGTLLAGSYTVKAWGGQGGGGGGANCNSYSSGGSGGYSYGTKKFNAFISCGCRIGYRGGQGGCGYGTGSSGSSSYRSGGSGGYSSSADKCHTHGGGGGGATAVYLEGTLALVAGGGGGGSGGQGRAISGGSGGGSGSSSSSYGWNNTNSASAGYYSSGYGGSGNNGKNAGGGGGGGYYGGQGGYGHTASTITDKNAGMTGGGGGTGYVRSGYFTSGSTSTGGNYGDGYVQIVIN